MSQQDPVYSVFPIHPAGMHWTSFSPRVEALNQRIHDLAVAEGVHIQSRLEGDRDGGKDYYTKIVLQCPADFIRKVETLEGFACWSHGKNGARSGMQEKQKLQQAQAGKPSPQTH